MREDLNKKLLIPLVILALLLVGTLAMTAKGSPLLERIAEKRDKTAVVETPVPSPAPAPTPTPEPTPIPHEHDWSRGVCPICGAPCPHERHKRGSLACAICGEVVPHSYVNGLCSRCGAAPAYISQPADFPEPIFAETEKHGALERYYFGHLEGEILPGVHEVVTREDAAIRHMAVYTPADYDPEGRYNVVIVSPAAGHDADEWLEKNNLISVRHARVPGRELLDGMIATGCIEPVIVAVVEYYHLGEPAEIAPVYERSLRERVLPFLASHYATYASFDENGGFVAAPEHFAYVGASFGAMIGWQMLPGCTDLFSYWGLYSGGYQNDEELAERIDRSVDAEHPINWIYASDGRQIESWMSYRNRIEKLAKSCRNLEEGKNISFFLVEKAGHSYVCWDIALYNCLQFFFHSRYEP